MGRESYQVRVHVIEARQLKGTDESAGFSCNPVAKLHLTAGEGATLIDKTQHTRKENETNTVWWDETKIFSEEFSREQFLSAKLEASCARRTRALPRLSTATPRAVRVDVHGRRAAAGQGMEGVRRRRDQPRRRRARVRVCGVEREIKTE